MIKIKFFEYLIMLSKRKRQDQTIINNDKKFKYRCNFCPKHFASSDGVSKHCRKKHQEDHNYQEFYKKRNISSFCYLIEIDNKSKIDYVSLLDEGSAKNTNLSNIVNILDDSIDMNVLIDPHNKLYVQSLETLAYSSLSNNLYSIDGSITNYNALSNVISQYYNYFQLQNKGENIREDEIFKQLQDMLIQKMINSIDYQYYFNMLKYNPLFQYSYYQILNNFALIEPKQVTSKDGLEIVEEFCQII